MVRAQRAVVAELDRHLGQLSSSQSSSRERLEKIREYLVRRQTKMDYKRLREQDLEISSGAVEGAVHYVIARNCLSLRLKSPTLGRRPSVGLRRPLFQHRRRPTPGAAGVRISPISNRHKAEGSRVGNYDRPAIRRWRYALDQGTRRSSAPTAVY